MKRLSSKKLEQLELENSAYGIHILYVKDKTPAGYQPFSEVKADIKEFLSKRQRFETIQSLVEGLKSSAKIEYLDKTLEPKTLDKQIEEALPKQIEFEQKMNVPKTKWNPFEKLGKKN